MERAGWPPRLPTAIHDEAELRQGVVTRPRRERLVHRLGLRARVDVGDDRVALLRVEVEGLVHHAVEVRDAVVRLDPELLGELVAGFQEQREIRLRQVEEVTAV